MAAASTLSTVPPSIEGPEHEAVVETISNPVSLACDATGIPPPSIVWLKNKKRLGKGHIFSGILSLVLLSLDSHTNI